MKNLIPEKYKNNKLLYSTTLFNIGFFIYFLSLSGVLFFDDEHLILNNKYIHQISFDNIQKWFTENSFSGAGRISEYYRPFLLFTFAINYLIHGFNPIGYHIVNNIIHALNGVVLFYLLNSYVFKKYWQSFLVSMIFLVHPMQSEGVAYVSGRGDLLSTFFMFMGVYFWLKIIKDSKKYFFCTFVSCFFLVLALLSRENGIVFPFLLLTFYVFTSKESLIVSIKNGLYFIIPQVSIVVAYLFLRLTVLNFRDFLNFGNYDTTSLYANSLMVRMYTFGAVFLEYMRTFFWPTNVRERFYFKVEESLFDLSVVSALLIFILLIVICIYLYKKEFSDFKIWFFGSLMFFVPLFPATGIVPTNVIIQDHRLYISMVGILVVLVHYIDHLFIYFCKRNYGYLKFVVLFILLVYVFFISTITVKRSIIWGKPIDLFEETLSYEPEVAVAYNALGKYYMDIGFYDRAKDNFSKAVLKNSDFPSPYHNMAEIIFVTKSRNEYGRAISLYKKAIEVDPKYRNSYKGLAKIYMEVSPVEAVYYFRRYLEFDSSDPDIYYNLALVLNSIGKKGEAILWLDRGLFLVKDNKKAQVLFMELKSKI